MPPKSAPKRSKRVRRNTTHRDIRSLIRGTEISVPPRPPPLQIAHWHPATLIHVASGDVSLTINDIANELRDQHGLFATGTTNRIPITMRLLAFQFWQTPAALSVSQFQVIVRNLDNFADMVRLTDMPAFNQWARVGYRWPSSQQQYQHNHDDTTNSPLQIDMADSTKWILYISILWRSLNGESYTQVYRNRSLSHQFEHLHIVGDECVFRPTDPNSTLSKIAPMATSPCTISPS